MNIRIGKYCCSMSLSGPIPFWRKAPARVSREAAQERNARRQSPSAWRAARTRLDLSRLPQSPALKPRPVVEQGLVPMVRLELTRLSPPPPQDGVSTTFTASARVSPVGV